jgi:UDP-3-O-[3-hydroxymyristoyl] glucosamine N-acyltransferase
MQGFQIGQIHPTAIISDKVKLSADVTIGANVIIYDNVEIEEKVFVGPNSILGEPLSGYYRDRDYENPQLLIGRGSILRAGAFLYAGSKIGEGFQCGTKVTIREGARLGHHCSVGSYSDLEGNCVIGDYVRLHSSVHIAQKTVIGSYVWVFPYTLFTNDPIPPSDEFVGARVEDFAVIASKVVIMPGVNIGKDALVSAMSLVQTDVPAETVVAGNPAKKIAHIRYLRAKSNGSALYPWRYRFGRYMPWENAGYENWRRKKKSLEIPSESSEIGAGFDSEQTGEKVR